MLESSQLLPTYGSTENSDWTGIEGSTASTVSDLSIPSRPPSIVVQISEPLPEATNYLSLVYFDRPLVGTYVIDNTIEVPQSLSTYEELDDPSAKTPIERPGRWDSYPFKSNYWDEYDKRFSNRPKVSIAAPRAVTARERPNGKFATSNAELNLVLPLRGSGRMLVEVELDNSWNPQKDATADHKTLNLTIASVSPDIVLNLSVKGAACAMFVTLPPNFKGVLKGGAERGGFYFSPRLQERTKMYSVNQQTPKDGRYFVGDLSSRDDERLRGDVVSVILENLWEKDTPVIRDVWIQDDGDIGEYKKFKAVSEEHRKELVIQWKANNSRKSCALYWCVFCLGSMVGVLFGWLVTFLCLS